jgi:hypothetical protein
MEHKILFVILINIILKRTRLTDITITVTLPFLVMWDFVMDKSGAGTGFLRELRFPLTIYIPSASSQSSSLSPEAGTIGQEWPQCQ